MAAADTVDELLGLKNQFYLGAFQTVINEATNPATAPRSEQAKLERRMLLHRAYICHGRFNLVLSELTPNDPIELVAVRTLAKYLSVPVIQTDARAAVVAEAEALAKSVTHATHPAVMVVLATVFYHEGRLDDALRLVTMAPKHLECLALTVQIYLKLDRLDLAKKEVKSFKSWADDATLAQLIESWVNIVSGGPEKYQEAFYIFEELANSTSTATSKLLTSKAVALIQARKFEAADALLLEALNKNPNDPDTIANMVVTATALHKPASIVNQYLSQLRDLAPGHPLAQDLALKESLFDRSAGLFASAK